MTLVKNSRSEQACTVCERSLLLGEQATRYKHDGGEWVDVCALCRVFARERGWVKEGAPSLPLVGSGRRKLRLLRMRRPDGGLAPVAADSVSRTEATQIDCYTAACTMFNESAFRRTVSGIAKSLGDPRASLVYLTGVKPEVVITVSWDLSWYQYRIVIADAPSIRLVERGYDIDELDERFRVSNAAFDADMALAPADHSEPVATEPRSA